MEYLPLASDPLIFHPETDPPCLYPEGVFVGSSGHRNSFLEEVVRENPAVQEDIGRIWSGYEKNLKGVPHAWVWENLGLRLNRAEGDIGKDPMARLWARAVIYGLGIRKRQGIVSHIMGPGGAVFGDPEWREVLGAGMYRGEARYGKRLARIYNRSAFVLDTRQSQARSGLTQRVFDAGLLGRPVLSEGSAELTTLFDPDRELFVFKNLEEGRALRSQILKEPREAEKKGKRLREKVLARHTYRHRAEHILKALNEHRA